MSFLSQLSPLELTRVFWSSQNTLKKTYASDIESAAILLAVFWDAAAAHNQAKSRDDPRALWEVLKIQILLT